MQECNITQNEEFFRTLLMRRERVTVIVVVMSSMVVHVDGGIRVKETRGAMRLEP
jgi:hypothetical protein